MIDVTPDVVTVAVTRADGGVTVLRVIVNEYQHDGDDKTKRVRTSHHEVTPEYVESLIAKYGWTGELAPVSWRFVPEDYVNETTDRTYRNAWKDAPGRNKPDHDMPKARNIHRERLRNARARPMDDLDVDYQRADERSDQQAKRDIAARKQKLRDVTADPRIEAAQTIEELKALTLEELTK